MIFIWADGHRKRKLAEQTAVKVSLWTISDCFPFPAFSSEHFKTGFEQVVGWLLFDFEASCALWLIVFWIQSLLPVSCDFVFWRNLTIVLIYNRWILLGLRLAVLSVIFFHASGKMSKGVSPVNLYPAGKHHVFFSSNWLNWSWWV